jgi:hypothetical protein
MLNPPGLVAGDVLLFDGGAVLDVIRFNPGQNGGSLLFYSDNVDGFDSPADTVGPPGALYANVSAINEGAIYTPLAGQPGFVAGASAPVTYKFLSEIPEPATLPLLGSGLIGLAVVLRKRRQAA